MLDFHGKELEVGDEVIFVFGKYVCFYEGVIVSLTPKMVRVLSNEIGLVLIKPENILADNNSR